MTWQDVARSELQSVPSKDRLAQLLGSLLKATIVSTIVMLLILPIGGVPIDGQPGTMSLFGWLLTTQISCCWMVLLFGHFWELKEGDATIRRLVMFMGGVGVGTLAFFTASFLNFSLLDFHRPGASPQWDWMAARGMPSLAHYAVNYGVLFAIFCWWKQADSMRRIRLSLLSAVASGFVAWMLPIIPLPWGYLMAATISITVQASAPFLSREDRDHYMIKARRYN